MNDTIVSTEPATGAEIWSGPVGDAAAEVAAARAALCSPGSSAMRPASRTSSGTFSAVKPFSTVPVPR